MMYLAVLCAAAAFVVPAPSGLFAVAAVVAGVGLAAVAEVNQRRWAASRAHAVEEAVWVATQSGYLVDATEGRLHWADHDQRRVATLDCRDGGWRLSLYATGLSAVDGND